MNINLKLNVQNAGVLFNELFFLIIIAAKAFSSFVPLHCPKPLPELLL